MLTTERKVYVAVLGLGLAALGADQLFFGSGAGSPAQAAASVASSGGLTTPVADAAPRSTGVKASASPAILTVAHRIEVMETRDGPPAQRTEDAFAPGAPFRALLATAQTEKPAEKAEPATTGPAKLLEQFKLTTIVKSTGGSRARAFINGKLYSVGDTIGDFVVSSINDEGVELTIGGENWVLTVPRPDNER